MSVEYTLNKAIRIGDLKRIGLDVKRDEEYSVWTVEDKENRGMIICGLDGDKDYNENELDNVYINEFSGKPWCGCEKLIMYICDSLNLLFITDDEFHTLVFEEDKYTPEETTKLFEKTTNRLREKLNKNGK